MLISKMLLSGFSPEKAPLYYHGCCTAMSNGSLCIQKGETLRFDTYFNAFFYGAYVRYSVLESITLTMSVSGDCEASLVQLDSQGNLQILFTIRTKGENRTISFPSLLFSSLPSDGMIYPQLTALSNSAYLHSGSYVSEVHTPNAVRVAAVICTYHREAYVERNLNIIRSELFSQLEPAAQALDVFVVDNGKTLSFDNTDRLKLFPNKNYGGSGGFTRGLIEALRCGDKYTHVLFMDDDISFEPETILRTIRLLQVLKPSEKPVAIGGQMLLENQPTLQFECGSSYVGGYLRPNNQGLDLSSAENLLLNSLPKPCQYNAWWYNCFPLSAVKKIGLPLPLFIKTDDIEYGLRMKADIILLNGIGIWHMAFAQKYSPHLEYYIKRNELLVSCLHNSGAGILPAVIKLLRSSFKAAFWGERRNLFFIIKGYQDFLQGPDFFLYIEEDQLNSELLYCKERPINNRLYTIFHLPQQIFPVIGGCPCLVIVRVATFHIADPPLHTSRFRR